MKEPMLVQDCNIFENRTRAIKTRSGIYYHPPSKTKIKPIFCGTDKTFPENWDSKATSVGTLLAYLETTA